MAGLLLPPERALVKNILGCYRVTLRQFLQARDQNSSRSHFQSGLFRHTLLQGLGSGFSDFIAFVASIFHNKGKNTVNTEVTMEGNLQPPDTAWGKKKRW